MKDKISNLIVNYAKMLGCYFLFFLIFGMLSTAFPSFDFERYQQTELFELLNDNPFGFAIMAMVIAPVLEEAAFRSLIRPTANEIIIFCCAWFIMIFSVLIPNDAHLILKYALLALTTILLFLFLKSVIPSYFLLRVQNWLHNYYRMVWIISALLFGLVHIFNYVDDFEINILLLLLIFPRIIAGYFFGKIKLENNNMIWPILMHSMNNSLVILFVLPYSLSYLT